MLLNIKRHNLNIKLYDFSKFKFIFFFLIERNPYVISQMEYSLIVPTYTFF